uniref:Uncharacterized protein n=1 Tax=Knipowitschia caucasica TaxID=637954 RepID=A0AAV2J958_KNICA
MCLLEDRAGKSSCSRVSSAGVPSNENHLLVIVIISVGAFTIIVVIVGAFLCTRRTNSHQKKPVDPSREAEAHGPVPIPRSSQDITPADSVIEASHLQQRRNSYRAVISAHPIHSLDSLQPQHYHSLASPTRTYLYHPQASGGRYHPCASPIAHLSRGESIGEAFHLTHCGSCSALTRCGECVT